MPVSAPPTTGPHDVPNLRLHLLDCWRVGGVFEHAARLMHEEWSLQGMPHGWRAREESEWQRRHLVDPDLVLWWVSAEMVDEITHVAGELPPDVRPVDLPGMVLDSGAGTHGLVVLGAPIVGMDSRRDAQLRVDGFLYGGTMIPPFDGHEERLSVSVAAYRRASYDEGLDTDAVEAMAPVMAAERELGHEAPEGMHQLHGELWLPLGRSDWPLLEGVATPINSTVTPQQHQSMAEDRRWLAALHLVAEDHRVATVKKVEPTEKRLRRPSERKKLPPVVRVVYLREPDPDRVSVARGSGGGKGKPRRLHIVRSHPRWQACGTEMMDRKLILVPRHTRGHGDGKAQEGPPTVKAVTR